MKFKEKAIYLSDLHFEHRQWTKELQFWQDEIATFQHRLEEVVVRWTDTDVLAQAEQFQNQFIRHREVIDELLHDISTHEQELSTFAEEHVIAIDHQHFGDHTKHRERMDTQRKIYHELKQNFFAFLTRAM